MEELTGFQRDLMYVIADNDQSSGQTIRRCIEPYYDEDVNHGRLYPNLDTLVEEGYIVKGSQDERTNFYKITKKGKDAILHRQQWERSKLENFGKEIEEPVQN